MSNFLSRVKPKDINKLQLEGLVKAGAFDNLNPNSVIYFIGSLWGSSQIVVLFISIIFLIKYKSFLSLAWLVFVLDNVLRIISMTMHNFDQNYLNSAAPGGLVGTSVMLFVTLFMFFISIIERKHK